MKDILERYCTLDVSYCSDIYHCNAFYIAEFDYLSEEMVIMSFTKENIGLTIKFKEKEKLQMFFTAILGCLI